MSITSRLYKIPQIRLSYFSDITVERPKVCDSASIAKIFRDSFEDGEIEYREHFKVAYLNRSNKVVGIHTISIGGTSATIVDKKLIFTGALLANASSIIICHNHPSGNTNPSTPDDILTRSIVEAGSILDIKVLDHIIVTMQGYYSYNDQGRL